MTTTTADNLTRHREWLDSQLARFGKRPGLPEFEDISPTYVIRVSRDWSAKGTLADIVINRLIGWLDQGADILSGVGVWEEEQEDSATITVQATDDVLITVLDRLATIEGIRWAHVEKHDVPTAYVDLNAR